MYLLKTLSLILPYLQISARPQPPLSFSSIYTYFIPQSLQKLCYRLNILNLPAGTKRCSSVLSILDIGSTFSVAQVVTALIDNVKLYTQCQYNAYLINVLWASVITSLGGMSRISGLRNDMNKRTFYKERKINKRCIHFLSKQKYKSSTNSGHVWPNLDGTLT